MKPRKEIFSVLRDKLQPLVTAGTVKFVDINKGQLSQPEKVYPIPFPAVLLQIDATQYQHKVEDRVEGDTTITLNVAFHNHYESFVGSPNASESDDLLDLLDTIVETLAYTRGETFTDLELSREQFLPYTYNGLHVHQISYTCKTYHKIQVKPKVKITIPN